MDKLKILIVEDDKITQVLYRNSLNDDIFEKQFANNGEDGLAVYKKWNPDIIILDIGLPDIDGISILNTIRTDLNDTKTTIIIATAVSDRQSLIECTLLGIHAYITKPFNAKDLTEHILKYHKTNSDSTFDPCAMIEIASYKLSNILYKEKNTEIVMADPGMEIMLHLKGISSNLKSNIIGIRHGRYIIVGIPQISHIDSMIQVGDKAIVIYAYADSLYSFEANIINYITSPDRLLFLSYPNLSDQDKLQEDHRVNCNIVGSIKNNTHNTELTGVLQDIGIGGCRFLTDETSGASPAYRIGDKIELTLKRTGSKGPFIVSGKLLNITQHGGQTSLAVEFLRNFSSTVETEN